MDGAGFPIQVVAATLRKTKWRWMQTDFGWSWFSWHSGCRGVVNHGTSENLARIRSSRYMKCRWNWPLFRMLLEFVHGFKDESYRGMKQGSYNSSCLYQRWRVGKRNSHGDNDCKKSLLLAYNEKVNFRCCLADSYAIWTAEWSSRGGTSLPCLTIRKVQMVQPCDAGTISNFKNQYRKIVIHKMLYYIDQGCEVTIKDLLKPFNVKKAILYASLPCSHVNLIPIANCFSSVGIKKIRWGSTRSIKGRSRRTQEQRGKRYRGRRFWRGRSASSYSLRNGPYAPKEKSCDKNLNVLEPKTQKWTKTF